MNIDNALYFKERKEWRKWLEDNGDTIPEIWLIHYKKHSNVVSISQNDAVEEALCFGWIDVKLKSVDEDRFILRYSPRKANSVWSKINRDKAEQLISQGKMTSSGLVKIEEAKKNGYWDAAYTNKTRDEIPVDLKKALMNLPIAWKNFESYANTYRNMYIGWVINSKTQETRSRRITEVVKRSALNKKAGSE